LFFVSTKLPVTTLPEFTAYAKAQSRKLTYASAGVGSSPHLAGDQLSKRIGVELVHVPYRGVAPAMQDLLGGHVPVVFGEMGSSKALVASGQLRALAVTGDARNPSVPDVPTFAEAGYTGFEVSSWFALFAPAATPKPVVARIAADVTAAVRSPQIKARLAADGWDVGGGTPEDFTKFWHTSAERFGKVIRERHISIK
jgi:tripartite-type tricarboxylate transporter receptor subunit TctC